MKNDREYLEDSMNNPFSEVEDTCICNLNVNITLDEIGQVVTNTKYRQATGFDRIP